MPQQLKDLFPGRRPSVSAFLDLLGAMPAAEQTACRQHAYSLTLHGWTEVNATYRQFLIHLVLRERQLYLNYLRSRTIFSCLACDPVDTLLLIKWMNLWLESQTNRKVSTTHFAFCLLLVFDIDLSVGTLRNYLSTCRLDTDELVELLKYVRLSNIDDH